MTARGGKVSRGFGAAVRVATVMALLAAGAWAAERPMNIVTIGAEDAGAPKYYGQRINLDFQDADVTTVLRLIAEVSGLNIVAGDDVVGKVTMKLEDVPWDQALALVLKAKKLGMEQEGNIIRVAPVTSLQQEKQQAIADKQQALLLEDLILDLIPVSYATAQEMIPQVQQVMSPRGNVTVDVRTNTVIVRDIGNKLDEIRALIQSLDAPTPQVLIEARIVEASTNFLRQAGIRWGGRYVADAYHGNSTGLIFPNTVGVTGGGSVGQQGSNEIPNIPDSNYLVNLPASIGLGSGGGLGITLGNINDTFALDLQLSALENRGEGRIISQPKVATLDNREASITQGVSIPFQIRQQGDTALSFIEANLNLTVTPHVTSDESIIMKIQIAKNAPNTAIPTSTGDPAIDKKEAKTEALVLDGETAVIGGIFQYTTTKTELGLPWISRVPVLGFFFRNKEKREERSELLIFITPRIVRQRPQV
jgi:type IV pilus assembly protein PilQ